MSSDCAKVEIDRVLFMFGDRRYAQLAIDRREAFSQATPFPHVVIDDFLPQDVALALYEGYPDPTADVIHHDNSNTSRKLQPDIGKFSPILRSFASALAAREFLLFLETISGINCLIPDLYLFGGGAMISENGDFLNIHEDFNWHYQLQLHRRVNVLLYLTPDWKPEYGGNLELHNSEQKVKEIIPMFNRLVVFATPGANHGQPVPVRAPSGTFRRVFSAFYYTSRPNEDEWREPHFTKYLPSNFELGMKIKADYESRGAEH